MRTLMEYVRAIRNIRKQQVNQSLNTSNNNIVFKAVTDDFLDYQYMYENTYKFNLLATKRPHGFETVSSN